MVWQGQRTPHRTTKAGARVRVQGEDGGYEKGVRDKNLKIMYDNIIKYCRIKEAGILNQKRRLIN